MLETNGAKRGRGRPKKTDAKRKQYRIRMSDEEMHKLKFISEKTGQSSADVIREGLRMYYNLTKFQHSEDD